MLGLLQNTYWSIGSIGVPVPEFFVVIVEISVVDEGNLTNIHRMGFLVV